MCAAGADTPAGDIPCQPPRDSPLLTSVHGVLRNLTLHPTIHTAILAENPVQEFAELWETFRISPPALSVPTLVGGAPLAGPPAGRFSRAHGLGNDYRMSGNAGALSTTSSRSSGQGQRITQAGSESGGPTSPRALSANPEGGYGHGASMLSMGPKGEVLSLGVEGTADTGIARQSHAGEKRTVGLSRFGMPGSRTPAA